MSATNQGASHDRNLKSVPFTGAFKFTLLGKFSGFKKVPGFVFGGPVKLCVGCIERHDK